MFGAPAVLPSQELHKRYFSTKLGTINSIHEMICLDIGYKYSTVSEKF